MIPFHCFMQFHTSIFLLIGIMQTDYKFSNYYILLYKLLLSTFALADTQDASCYKLCTCFISPLTLRVSGPLCFKWITAFSQYVQECFALLLELCLIIQEPFERCPLALCLHHLLSGYIQNTFLLLSAKTTYSL